MLFTVLLVLLQVFQIQAVVQWTGVNLAGPEFGNYFKKYFKNLLISSQKLVIHFGQRKRMWITSIRKR
jgi:hypothetical protein